MKVLVVSAHPDDLEISCAGTLKKLQDRGHKIISVVTVCPSKEDNPNREQFIVEKELRKSYQHSGFDLRVFDTDLHSNGRPNLLVDNVTMTRLCALLEPCDIAIIPNPQDSHQDHRNTYHLVYPWLVTKAKQIWLMDSYPYMLRHQENTANLYHNISGEPWEFKQTLLECYNSTLNADKINQIRQCNVYRGLAPGFEMAEAFTIVQKYVD